MYFAFTWFGVRVKTRTHVVLGIFRLIEISKVRATQNI